MNRADFEESVNGLYKECLQTLVGKAAYYAPDQDRLGQFKTAYHITKLNPVASATALMVKHTTKMYDMLMGRTPRSREDWREVAVDHINYILLINGLLEERGWNDER